MTKLEKQLQRRHGHAKVCRKPLNECKTCQDNVRWFGQLPLSLLAKALA